MAWRLEGTYFENCNCDAVCPCAATGFAVPADNERCLVMLAFHVDSGEIDGLDVSDLSYAIVVDAPGAMAEGGWRIGLLMDDAASPEQAEALTAVASGSRGGAPAGFNPLVGEVIGMESAPMDYADDGTRHSIRIGELVDVEVEDFVLEGAGTTVVANVPHPVNTTLALSRATRSRVRAFGLEFDNVGKNGHSAPFSWAG
jgi:hypothetical protein